MIIITPSNLSSTDGAISTDGLGVGRFLAECEYCGSLSLA